MSRLLILLYLFLVSSCNADRLNPQQTLKQEYPTTAELSRLPKQINAIGTITEVSYGYCGIFCQGGYIKVDLDSNKTNYKFKAAYIITACLSTSVKTGDKVDVMATLHTGQEQECYYKSFDTPKDRKDIVFYKLTEAETQKVH
jgi:hypothetical protein